MVKYYSTNKQRMMTYSVEMSVQLAYCKSTCSSTIPCNTGSSAELGPTLCFARRCAGMKLTVSLVFRLLSTRDMKSHIMFNRIKGGAEGT